MLQCGIYEPSTEQQINVCAIYKKKNVGGRQRQLFSADICEEVNYPDGPSKAPAESCSFQNKHMQLSLVEAVSSRVQVSESPLHCEAAYCVMFLTVK